MLTMLALVVALFLHPVADKPDCRQIEAITGGVELEWLGYEQGGWDLPDDLELTERIDFGDGGIWQYRSKSHRGTRWIWWWGDYEPGHDENGNYNGNHHFCAIKVVTS